jgi:hypothetical protein
MCMYIQKLALRLNTSSHMLFSLPFHQSTQHVCIISFYQMAKLLIQLSTQTCIYATVPCVSLIMWASEFSKLKPLDHVLSHTLCVYVYIRVYVPCPKPQVWSLVHRRGPTCAPACSPAISLPFLSREQHACNTPGVCHQLSSGLSLNMTD